jgi:uncharacterized membrane protein
MERLNFCFVENPTACCVKKLQQNPISTPNLGANSNACANPAWACSRHTTCLLSNVSASRINQFSQTCLSAWAYSGRGATRKRVVIMQFPPIPSWQALHPLIVHFPIALLLIAPLFVIAGAVLRSERGRWLLISALILMIAGTTGTFVARATGDAASKLIGSNPQVHLVLENHEELAETTSLAFSVLSLTFAAIVFAPRFLPNVENRVVSSLLPLAFLIFYSAGAVLLLNTAHNGGRLVHELGVHAAIGSPAKPVAAHQSVVSVSRRDSD